MGDHKEQPLRVGAAVRRRRRAQQLTLAAVAERSGLSVPFLSQVENERARPSRPSLDRIADALGTTAVELLAAADPACSVDVVRAADEDGFTPPTPARAPWCAGTTSCTPWSSPATTTRAARSSTATTS